MVVRPARELLEHAVRVGLVGGLAQDDVAEVLVEVDDRVRGEDELALRTRVSEDLQGLRPREALHELAGALVRERRLVDVRGTDGEREPRLAHELHAAGRLGGEDHSWMPSLTLATAFSPAMSPRTASAKGSAWPMPEAVMMLPSTTTVFSPA